MYSIRLCVVKICVVQAATRRSNKFRAYTVNYFHVQAGLKWGMISGAIYGIIRLIFGGYFMNVIQVLLDYPLAFACVGFAAISPKILGIIIAAVGTISCSVISGVIFFAQFAPEGQHPFIYSLIVNVPVLGGLYILSGITALILWKYLQKFLS